MVIASLMTAILSVIAPDSAKFDAPVGPSADVIQLLEESLAKKGEAPDRVSQLKDAISATLKILPPESPIAERLAAVTSRDASQAELETEAADAIATLRFVPKKEADLPVGFPTYTPVGMLETKAYPAYRQAKANAFWTLFGHITSNQIEMTAPVEMHYSEAKAGDFQQASMSFLYGTPDIGSVGKKGAVEVIDAPPTKVVAIGIRGRISDDKIADADARLRRWLARQDQLTATGDIRVMGYNSPMLPASRQFFEVQLELKEKPKSK